jgi:membrane associated rhomboid family serine protease
MFIIPIGTKSTLALKPKLTIGLIAVNILVSIITIPLMMQSQSDLFKVQRERFARQLELYLREKSPASIFGNSFQGSVSGAIGEIEKAKDYQSLRIALLAALSTSGVSPQAFEDYEKTLRGRTESAFMSIGGAMALFEEWKTLVAREERIVQGSVFNTLGLIPSKMSRVHTFLTHIFLHAGIWHLLGNMLFLWVVGCLLEDSWGRVPFLVFYLFGGVIAGLAHSFQDTSSTMPLVGASGAIAAAMGAFTIRHFFTKIKLWYFFLLIFRPFWGTFYVPAFVFLPLWFIEQVGFHYVSSYVGASNVAYMAHIGGFAAGLFVALAVRATGFEERFLAPRVRRKQVEAGVSRDPRFDRACEMLQSGRIESAKTAFNQLLRENPENVDLMQDVALLYREKGLTADYQGLVDKSLKVMLPKGRLEDASRLVLEIVSARDTVTLNPQYLMRVAKWLGDREHYGEAHDVYRAIISSTSSPGASTKARIALARLLSDRMNNAPEALRVLADARNVSLDAEWAAAVAELEEEIKGSEVVLQP